MLILACVRLRFFVVSFERSDRGLAYCQRAQAKKRGLAIKLPRAQSPAHIITRSNPHGVHKPTRNDPLGQFLFPTVKRPWTVSVSRGRSAGAFFIRPWGYWYGGSHDTASVDFFRLPKSSQI